MRRLSIFVALCLFAPNGFAQAWPNRPMRLVMPFAPGGGADIAGRLIAQELGEVLKQPVLVENRAGAGGTLALDNVAKSAADGYSIAFGHVGGIAIAPALFKTLPFDPIRDLIPVTLAVNGLNVLVVNRAARMILPHFAISASMNARNGSGVLPTGPAPSASSFSLIDGCRSSATTS
jgi:tripartite-type tricarboxylate transporter receptor subunit TctC